MSGATGILRSTDNGATWAIMNNSGTQMEGVVGDGTTLWASSGYPYNAGQWPPAYEPFLTAPETAAGAWTALTTPMLLNGGALAYDSDHHILYSSDLYAGFYRAVFAP
jgi:hypothetical protein